MQQAMAIEMTIVDGERVGMEEEAANIDSRVTRAIEAEGTQPESGRISGRIRVTENMADMFDVEGFPDLELPGPFLPTPRPLPSDRSQPISSPALASLTSPRLHPGTPRTRFDFSPTAPAATNNTLSPLRPIISLAPASPAPFIHLDELDVTEQGTLSATFPPRRELDYPDSPSHIATDEIEPRVPHPLYTPTVTRRERRRHASRASRSQASGRTARSARSARSMVKSAWRNIKLGKLSASRRQRRTETMSTVNNMASATSVTSSSSSRSNSTWNGWRFWRNSSDGSSSSGDSSDTEDEYEPPTPHFTLLTPYLSRASTAAYPNHLRHGETQSESNRVSPVFELVTSTTIAPTLERLQTFWAERRQEDSVSGDVGAAEASTRSGSSEQATSPSIERNAQLPIPATIKIGGGKLSKGEEKAAKAEQMRGSKVGNPPAWWYDVSCPTVADMRELRKILPLHPLTMEDILQQETREKIETFPTLGYYFVVFRALDETYYKYTSPVTSPANVENLAAASKMADKKASNESGQKEEDHASTMPSRARGRFDIVERVGGKEGVEGVGVGAVNLYLVVFADGIISFHFEDVSKHVERVQSRIQQFGLIRVMSADWIAYNLMDSVVDTFFPLIDFIEQESNEVDNFLANPFGAQAEATEKDIDNSTSTLQDDESSIRDEKVKSDSASGKSGNDTKSDGSQSFEMHEMQEMPFLKSHVVLQQRPPIIGLPIPTLLQKLFPGLWTSFSTGINIKKVIDPHSCVVNAPVPPKKSSPFSGGLSLAQQSLGPATSRTATIDAANDRARMLKTIADTRKLITGLTRMLTPKTEVINGLRKRTKEVGLLGKARNGETLLDIENYLGDLSDHIIAMQQTLVFYDHTLAQQHPAFIGMLRLSLLKAKHGTDILIIKLYIIVLTILPMNVLIGLFSLNVNAPTEGIRYFHTISVDDPTPAGMNLFYYILVSVVAIAALLWLFVWVVFQFSRRTLRRKQARRRQQATVY